MSTGPSVRVLLFHPDRPVSRTAIDWIIERQRYARVIVPSLLRDSGGLPPRALHEPFTPPDPGDAQWSAELSALLVGRERPVRAVAEATVLALLAGGAVVAADGGMFRDLIPLSSWSMNVPERPTDGLLVQHLGIAGRLPGAWRDGAEEAVEAVLAGESSRVARIARARRLRARKDGPERFGRLAKKSAGLRPGVVYLDLLASPGAATPAFMELLRRLDRPLSISLLSAVAAVFI